MKKARIILLTALLGLLASGFQPEVSVVSQVRNKGVDPEWATKIRNAPKMGMYSRNLPRDLFLAVYESTSRGGMEVPHFAPNGGWMVSSRFHHGLPVGAVAGLKPLEGQNISHAAFAPNGAWVYVYGQDEWTKFSSKNLPQDMQSKLEQLYKNGKFNGYQPGQDRLSQIKFTPNGGWIITYSHNAKECVICPSKYIFKAAYNNLPQDVENKIVEFLRQGKGFSINFTPSGGWLILHSKFWNEPLYNRVPEEAVSVLAGLTKRGEQLMKVAFGPKGSWVILASCKPNCPQY